MQQMELYKKYGIKPFRSILVLIIQLPIFIGLYQVIRIISLHRDQVATLTYDVLEKIGPIQKIIEDPNSFNHTMLGFIDLTKVAVSNTGIDITLVVLAVISAVTQYIMTKQTMPTGKSTKKFRDIMKEAAEGKEPNQTEMNAVMMNNMMKFMPIMMFFIMMSLPGALALYYTASNLVAVGQQHYLLTKDQEDLEEIANIAPTSSSKKAKDRVKNAKEAHVTRIKAKD